MPRGLLQRISHLLQFNNPPKIVMRLTFDDCYVIKHDRLGIFSSRPPNRAAKHARVKLAQRERKLPVTNAYWHRSEKTMNSSPSLTAIHPRRLHGRSASVVVHADSADDLSANVSTPSTESPSKQSPGLVFISSRWGVLMLGYAALSVLFFTAYLSRLELGIIHSLNQHGGRATTLFSMSKRSKFNALCCRFESAATPVEDSSPSLY
jgi:hypothetical protein